jgi:hypothetical protein
VRHYQCGEEEISVEALIEEQRRVSVSQNPFERVIGSLCLAALLKQRLAALPDEAVGQLMVDHVCNDLNVFSPETTICEVATERLRESAIVIVPKKARVEKCETSLVCPKCGAEFWRADE